jgi:lauroyl/myristoyl acyltransferase
LLKRGEVVGIQGDRVVGDVSPMKVRCGQRVFTIPRGPLLLAEMTKVPCYPVFLRRLGRLSYEATIGAPFSQGGVRTTQAELAERWLGTMAAFLDEHWDQWFVFEPLVDLWEENNPNQTAHVR